MIMEMRAIHLLEPVKIDGVSYRAGHAIMPLAAADACIANGWGMANGPDPDDGAHSYRFIDIRKYELSPCKNS